MTLGVSLFLIAVGAILAFAVTATVQGIDITLVGIILMVVGGIGLLLSLMLPGLGSPFFHHGHSGDDVRPRDHGHEH